MSFTDTPFSPSPSSSSTSSIHDASSMLYSSPISSATSTPPSVSSARRLSDSGRDSPQAKYFRDRSRGFDVSASSRCFAGPGADDGASDSVELASPGTPTRETALSPSPNHRHGSSPASYSPMKTGRLMNSWTEEEEPETRSKRWSLDSATTDTTLVDTLSPSSPTIFKSYFPTQNYRPSLLSRGVYQPSDYKKDLLEGDAGLVQEGFTGKGMRPLLLLSRRSSSYTDDIPSSRKDFPSPTLEPPATSSSPIGLGISFQSPSPSPEPTSFATSPSSTSSLSDSDSEYDDLPHIPLPSNISIALSSFAKFLSPDAFDEKWDAFEVAREIVTKQVEELGEGVKDNAVKDARKGCLRAAGSPPRSGVKGVRFDVLPPRHNSRPAALKTILIRPDLDEEYWFSSLFGGAVPRLPSLIPSFASTKPRPAPPETNIPLLFMTLLLSILVTVVDCIERGIVGVVRGWMVGEMVLEGARVDEQRRLVRRARRRGRDVVV
ncbi:hypothetical protein IAR50_003147 [Cryptococcus sp. DSM 104548]